MSEILVTMRKEVGLGYFNSISNNEALAFLSMMYQAILLLKVTLWMQSLELK